MQPTTFPLTSSRQMSLHDLDVVSEYHLFSLCDVKSLIQLGTTSKGNLHRMNQFTVCNYEVALSEVMSSIKHISYLTDFEKFLIENTAEKFKKLDVKDHLLAVRAVKGHAQEFQSELIKISQNLSVETTGLIIDTLQKQSTNLFFKQYLISNTFFLELFHTCLSHTVKEQVGYVPKNFSDDLPTLFDPAIEMMKNFPRSADKQIWFVRICKLLELSLKGKFIEGEPHPCVMELFQTTGVVFDVKMHMRIVLHFLKQDSFPSNNKQIGLLDAVANSFHLNVIDIGFESFYLAQEHIHPEFAVPAIELFYDLCRSINSYETLKLALSVLNNPLDRMLKLKQNSEIIQLLHEKIATYGTSEDYKDL
jgi:hypothetical protein